MQASGKKESSVFETMDDSSEGCQGEVGAAEQYFREERYALVQGKQEDSERGPLKLDT